jgi:hypothetical protein
MKKYIVFFVLILLPVFAMAQWLSPENMGDVFNTSVADNTPFISAGGDTIMWASFRSDGMGSMDIWMSTRDGGGEWNEAINLGAPVNTSGLEATPCLSADGQTLYFSSPSQGGEGGWDILVSTWDGMNWTAGVNLGPDINSADQDWHPHLSIDGTQLYFSSSRNVSDDIFVSTWNGSEWGPAQELPGEVNSELYDEESPTVTADGLNMYFSSNLPGGQGGVDLWGSHYNSVSETWGPPYHLGVEINTSDTEQFPAVSSDGTFMVLISNRPGGFGNFDLWMSQYLTTYTVYGIAGLGDSPADSSGTVAAIGTLADTTDEHGYYSISEVPSGSQLVHFFHDGYDPFDTTITVDSDEELNVTLQPGPNPTSFFDDFESGLGLWFGSWDLTEEQSYSPTHSLTESPGGDYIPNRNMSMAIVRGVDLTEALGAELSYWTRYEIEENFDFFYVEVSDDGGDTWLELASFTGNQYSWRQDILNLGDYAGLDNIKIRFRFTSDGAVEEDGVYIDDVNLIGTEIDTRPPRVQHDPLPSWLACEEEFTAMFTVTDISGVDQVRAYYNPDGTGEVDACLDSTVNDLYYFTFPVFFAGTCVEYRLEASDLAAPPNQGEYGSWSYYCGHIIYYDDNDPEFIYQYNAGQGIAVRFTPDDDTFLAGLFFRFYTDPSYDLDTVDVHVWSDLSGFPHEDLIEAVAAYPVNTLETPHAWSFVDLRLQHLQVSEDFHGGCIFRSNEPVILGDSPGISGRSSVYTDSWFTVDEDYHIRALVGEIPGECQYTPGDANGDGNVMGNDVTYSVRYFKGIGNPPPDSCQLPDYSWLYAAGDANGNCTYAGSDVTFLVAYFKGQNPAILYCPETPPGAPPLLMRNYKTTVPFLKR